MIEIKNELKVLKEEYERRIKSLEETKESKEFKEHYKGYSDEAYVRQYSYIRGKVWELSHVITDLEELVK